MISGSSVSSSSAILPPPLLVHDYFQHCQVVGEHLLVPLIISILHDVKQLKTLRIMLSSESQTG